MSETFRAFRRGQMLSMRSAVSRHYSPLGKIKRKKARRPQHVRVRWLPPSDQLVILSAARPAAAPTGVELTMRMHSRQPVVHHRLRVAIRQRSESPSLLARSIASPVELSRAIAGAIGNEGAVVDHRGAYRNTVQRSC